MRKTRITALILLLALAAAILSGCHGTMDQNAAKEGYLSEIPLYLDETKKIELTFWAKNDTNKTQTQIYEKAISDFEALYPNVDINMRLYTDYGKIYNDVITNISTNTTPNICITYPDHIATYMTGDNVVVPLDSLIANSKYGLAGSELKFDGPSAEEVVPQFLEECAIGGTHYALPYMRSTEACYVNKTFVEKLGYELPDVLTWDFIWEVSEAAMAKDADGNFLVNGQKVMIPFIDKSTDNMMIQMLKEKDAGYSTDEGEVLLFNDTTREILKTVSEHAKTGAFSTFKISSYPANFLDAGQCIFAIDSTAGATWMGSHAPLSDISKDKFVEFETEVRMFPQYDPASPKMISQGPSVCIFNKEDPQVVLASWLFAQYLTSNDVQIAYSQTEGYVPVTLKAQTSEEYQDYLSDVKIKAAKLLIDNVQYTFVTPVFNGSTSLRDAAGQLIEDVTKAVRRKKTVDDAYLDALFDDVTALYRLDQTTGMGSGSKEDMGPLPTASKALIATLAVTWILIGIYYLRERMRKSQK